MILVEAEIVDSTHLKLSKPIGIRQGKTVLVSVTESEENDEERQQWLTMSSHPLGMAYSESDPDYPESMVKEFNTGYES